MNSAFQNGIDYFGYLLRKKFFVATVAICQFSVSYKTTKPVKPHAVKDYLFFKNLMQSSAKQTEPFINKKITCYLLKETLRR